MPWGLVLAVLIDSVVDGMLIGLAGSVQFSSGLLMAIATAIEMGFLGYSFACSVMHPGKPSRYIVLCIPPIAMLWAAMAAAALAIDVQKTATFTGLIAFAFVALLFLVLEELLVEAHEKDDSEAWHVSVWLYVGLFLSICLDVVSE